MKLVQKPVYVEAVQIKAVHQFHVELTEIFPAWFDKLLADGRVRVDYTANPSIIITTRGGSMRAHKNDWIVNKNGDISTYKGDIFKDYELVNGVK